LANQQLKTADSLATVNAALKNQYDQKQINADNYLASVESNKSEKINKVVGPEKNNLIAPEVTYTDNVVVDDPVAFAKNFKAPIELTNNIYVKSNAPAYNATNPIPVNPEMPKGTYYMVQVGAFRNAIPQDLFKEFVPIRGETTPTGLTRYTVGYFTNFDAANDAKKEIRGFGYKDAFVVGFRDGKRVSLTELPVLANNNNANNNNVNNNANNNANNNNANNNNANNNANNNNANNANNNNNVNNNTNNNNVVVANNVNINNAAVEFNNFTPDNSKVDYYKGTPNAAKANQVEVIKGLFYTVQVGVYSKPVSLDKLYGIQPLNSELTATRKIRYTTGIYTKFAPADSRSTQCRN
jgi:hypothetical protein